jgi:tRNA threonylcarbamoyladenosine biosynthesis protein TsaE
MTITIKNLSYLSYSATRLLKYAGRHKILAFYGAMGSGKTTIIKHICRALGTTDEATSPTFAIANEYKTQAGESVYHFDFYRIKKIEEAFDIGLEEYFASGSYCFIEWPEMIEEALPPNVVKIHIHVEYNNFRLLDITFLPSHPAPKR